MTNKEILHEILKGMDPYLSTGVPEIYWNLAIKLTREIYGEMGVELLESAHITFNGAVDYKDETILHSLEKWEDKSTWISIEVIIDRLEAMN